MWSLLRHPIHYKQSFIFFTKYKNEWEECEFRRQKDQKNNFCKNKKLFKIDDIDVDKTTVFLKNHMAQISQLNISLDIMTTMILDLHA